MRKALQGSDVNSAAAWQAKYNTAIIALERANIFNAGHELGSE